MNGLSGESLRIGSTLKVELGGPVAGVCLFAFASLLEQHKSLFTQRSTEGDLSLIVKEASRFSLAESPTISLQLEHIQVFRSGE